MPFFGDLTKLFSSQGPVNWEVARQIATWTATEGEPEANVDPLERIRLEELCRVAELHVADVTGLSTSPSGRRVAVRPVGRGEWAGLTLTAYRTPLERLASSLGQATVDAADPSALGEDELEQGQAELLGGFAQMMSPLLLGMQSGFMVGHLSRRSLGQYDLPIPRPLDEDLTVIVPNLLAFAEDWSLPPDDVRLWVCIDLVAHHAVLAVPHVRERLEGLLLEYVGGFRTDPSGLESQLGSIDPSDPSSWERTFGSPDQVLGAMQTEEQRRLLPRIEAVTAVVEGYVDHVMDTVGQNLIGSYGPLTEALRRRRVERNDGDRFVERLLGLALNQAQYDRGARFIRGIVERAGEDGLLRLWRSDAELPTPAEVDAPGLWWERINL